MCFYSILKNLAAERRKKDGGKAKNEERLLNSHVCVFFSTWNKSSLIQCNAYFDYYIAFF